DVLPSSISLRLSYSFGDMEASAQVGVTTTGVERPSGVVVFSEAGQELGRAILRPGSATEGEAYTISYLRLAPGTHVIDATYLGDGATESSTTSGTLTVPAPVDIGHMIPSGTVRVGDLEAPMGPNGRFGGDSTFQ